MIDLLLINPSAPEAVYGNLAYDLAAIEPPLWCRILGAYVKERGYEVRILDAEAMRVPPDSVARVVKQLQPRLTCIVAHGHQPSASTQQMVGAIATAKAIKQQYPSGVVMVLGGHVSALPKRTLEETREFDYACVGEGPQTILGLLQGDVLIPGLVHRHKHEVRINPSAPLIDIDELHGDAWSMLPPVSRYRAHNWQCFGGWPRSPYAAIHTSLGCPWKCHFCCIHAPFDTNRYRMRNTELVVREFVALHRNHGVKTFKVIDEMFVLNEKHYGDICQGLIEAGIGDKINIWAYSRVDTVKADKLDLLRRAGFRWLALGIESGSQYVRDGAQKRLKNNDIIRVVRDIQAAGINVIGNYIFGLPDDNHESMTETLELAIDANCEFANFYAAQAYPGSPLYTQAVSQGWALPESWAGYSQHGYESRPLDTFHLSGKQVLAFRDQAFTAYFSGRRYLDMIYTKFGPGTVAQITAMTARRLPRRLLEAA